SGWPCFSTAWPQSKSVRAVLSIGSGRGVDNLAVRVSQINAVHSPPRRGGVARSAGVVSSAERLRRSDHPVCAASVASRHSLMAQPPLLCEEGNIYVTIITKYCT